MAHLHNIVDTDPHFTIDATTRNISSQSTDKIIIIQSDHNSERFTFEMERYVDGHDMLTCNKVQVHYINIGDSNRRKVGMYDVTDLQLKPDDENTIMCSWLVSQNATSLVGALTFVIRFACTNGGKAEYVWNTAVYSGISVATGIDNSEIIVEQYADILETWYYELLSSGSMGVNIVTDARDKAIADITEHVNDTIANLSEKDIFEIVVNQATEEFSAVEEKAIHNIQSRVDGIVREVLASLPRAEGALF